jgi:lipid II isoglutaminyl synthase (glutamine-hydrolysing)
MNDIPKTNYLLRIGWLYPDLMSTYGDRGNITILTKRCEWRGISVEIVPITKSTSYKVIEEIDLLFGGGAQDREQEIVMNDLRVDKGRIIIEKIEDFMPALFVCGSPQLMGNYYEPSIGQRIEGLGIFDMHTIHPGLNTERCIGNIVIQMHWDNILQNSNYVVPATSYVVGFENHGGRTFLGKNATPLARVIKGFGNNGQDKTEGVVYKNALGTYLHGPLLPKNPMIADYIIARALQIKYKEEIPLSPLDDSLELKARSAIAKKLNITV